MTLHLQYAPHLRQRHLLSVAQANDLIKCTKQIESVFEDFPFFCTSTHVRHNAGDQVQRLDVLKDIRGLVRDQEDVKLLQRLVDVSNLGSLDRRVLCVCRDEFWEGSQKGFNPGSRHVSELARNHGCGWKIGIGVVGSRLDLGVWCYLFRLLCISRRRGQPRRVSRYYLKDAGVVICIPSLILDVKRCQSCLQPVVKVR